MDGEDDDWLESLGDGQGGKADPLVDQEWHRIEMRYSDAGYREGITDGKLSTLQQGFDEGFALSVPASRSLGTLRGRANALLSYLIASSSSSASPGSASIVEEVRNLIRNLGRVRRDDVLPPDVEKEEHEKEHEEGYELDQNEKRDMEGIERALEGMGEKKANGEKGMREGELLGHLEVRLAELERRVFGL